MNIVSGKALPRRTFLKGMGATLALPYLDAMMPAVGTARKASAMAAATPTRFIAWEMVHGAAGSNVTGQSQYLWAPEGVGSDFGFVEKSALKNLEPLRDYLTIISNTDVRMAEPIGNKGEIGGDHFRSSAVFLTQAHPKQTNGSDLFAGVSIDQLVAKRIAGDTAFPSVQLCIEHMDAGGGCTYNYSCSYMDTISWSDASTPLPAVRDPRIAFDMLFGVGADNTDRAARRKQNASILDWLGEETRDLKRSVGKEDGRRIEQHLENVREIERRIQVIEKRNSSGEIREIPEAPQAVPDSFVEHMKLMSDFQVLALQTDLTRVISFKTGRDASNRTYPEAYSFAGRPYHQASHYGTPAAILQFNDCNKHFVDQLVYFAKRLKETPDGDSNLLEKSLVMLGSPMGDSNLHNHRRCPLIVVGHANGKLAGNMHIKAPEDTPMANAFVSIAQAAGLSDVTQFGDSSGALPLHG
jgi:hypothetical protein